MDNKITEVELSLLENTDFLLTKYEILEKINKLLEDTRKRINEFLKESNFNVPNELKLKSGKVSKGENYKHLPYFVLDCPALFSDENIFAYRTMFWWGNFFSSTLHQQGKSLEKYKNNIISNFDNLLNKDIYICVGKTPWEYHYENDNYVLIENKHKEFITDCKFLKLSKKIALKDWESLPEFSAEFLKFLLTSIL